jgi:hypothetical protein
MLFPVPARTCGKLYYMKNCMVMLAVRLGSVSVEPLYIRNLKGSSRDIVFCFVRVTSWFCGCVIVSAVSLRLFVGRGKQVKMKLLLLLLLEL